MVASSRGFTKVMGLLLEHEADPHYCIPKIDTPVHVECSECEHTSAHDYNPLNRYMCHKCEASTEHISSSHSSAGMNAMHSAAARGHTAALQVLLDHGVNVNAKTTMGNTPLWYAATGGHKDAAELILKSKGEVNATNIDSETPLHVAVENGDKKVVDLLLEHSADPLIRNCRDMSPSLLADEGGNPAICTALVAAIDRCKHAGAAFSVASLDGSGFEAVSMPTSDGAPDQDSQTPSHASASDAG
eukprot:CAMPEP_0175834058 /NCGR_PEP_ID=MMETSP0107_2-20121207/15846_1 /TAXON_ID=195067 ORGANISM="Goniomonas pacifica, Strain CCMP1869" /NCGR_SAMPLE_ID=MMETSP0107_2 /ASSEMBLY_ACC=CAM_ASM_000203 /LENGTH=244 /DNA_ID=CAMNT_0017147239 /DNA_START=242 /DNA_END=976 /DNA_ORIENTATION=+